MATRATITIEGLEGITFYKHWDGDPASTLPWLREFNKDFAEKRGDDAGYKAAQLMRDSVRSAEKFGLDDSKHTGWGIFAGETNLGEDYRYHLERDGSVEVRGRMGKIDGVKLEGMMK